MKESRFDSVLTIEINILEPEKVLNIISKEGIFIKNVKRLNIALLSLDVYEEDYKDIKKIVKANRGKIKIVKERGRNILIRRLKRRSSLLVGSVLFGLIIFILSTHIWSIDIKTTENLSPYEVREILSKLGVKQGMKKNALDVYSLEKKLEDSSSEIVWARSRIEGSTLKIDIEEKVNPPKLLEKEVDSVIATMDGEVKRIYTESGTAVVEPGNMVKKGDILIEPYNGSEGTKYECIASGKVMANTFYDKEVDIRISGKELKRTGESFKEKYITFFGRRIYLKKYTNSFKEYDKIEDNTGLIKGVEYFEKELKEVKLERDEEVLKASKKLEKLLLKDLTNEAKVVGKDIDVTDLGDGMIRVKVQFVVLQDIAL
ncbi:MULTISPECIES: sporulation protein YqfD [Clostridium]|uniref:sporulation protein YqfD n=1 Tax=Clostridium TaxID=1485 RepID=UPI0021523384|nr:sporulation protein YqfD [Clostridium sp. LY3-2]MCR6513493.1 sporulation protein YqfD [Clostridium sp. LY3-2]